MPQQVVIANDCGAASGQVPFARRVVGRDNGSHGFSMASQLIVQSGGLATIRAGSVFTSGNGIDQSTAMLDYCCLPLHPTSVIPAAFPPPIMIVEE